MDELAAATGVDPIELRLRNYSEKDYNENKPYTSKELRACYAQGAARLAGRSEIPSRARCAKVANSSATAWRAAYGKRFS